ncbi:MAG: hypothetical protein F6K42_31750 [Leptolyngbya sp. SIO1D8]|nr:hypothetical protein [Leptolyngbya sp. SIO1D8]
MPWTTLILLALAIAAWRFTQNHSDDVGQFLGGFSALVFFIGGLITAPLIVRGVVLLGLLVYPSYSTQLEPRQKSTYPQLHRLHSRGRPSLKQYFSPLRRN